jgi:hypothetical protein
VADTKVSALTAVASVIDAQEFPVNDAGASKKASMLQLKAYMADQMGNWSTAAQSPVAATLTYLTGSSIAVPVGKLRIGTQFRWVLDVSKSAAGTAIRTFHVRIGTAGTTGDAAVLTFTGVLVPTAVADNGIIRIAATIRGPLSASCIMRGIYELQHNLAATGLSTRAMEILAVTSAGFDATVANLIVGLSVTTGAAEVLTFEQVHTEAKQL